jgi:hypothetical protein
MTNIQISNRLIAKFMGVKIEYLKPNGFGMGFWMASDGGLKPPFPTSFSSEEDIEYTYHWDWNTLMDACLKWDNLHLLPMYQIEYEGLCDRLDNKVSCYEIEGAYNAFIDCMQWYEAKSKR